jgi:hypothetical protein
MQLKFVFLLLIYALLFGCNQYKTKEYIHSSAYIIKTNHIHMGYGLYKLKVTYEYVVNDSIIVGDFIHKYERITTKSFSHGDSIIIRYNKEIPHDSEFVKISFKKPATKTK